jgi:hypothetical protein
MQPAVIRGDPLCAASDGSRRLTPLRTGREHLFGLGLPGYRTRHDRQQRSQPQ